MPLIVDARVTLTERDEIQEAAGRTGDPWLAYMARHAEPDMTPLAWNEALEVARGTS